MLQSLVKMSLAELKGHWRESALMASVVAVSLLAVLLLDAYRYGMENRYNIGPSAYLAARQIDAASVSRLEASSIELLRDSHISQIIPEITTAIGTTPENALLLRGIPLENYAQVETFQMVAGKALQSGDEPRMVMIGIGLSELKNISPGDSLSIRGRPFTVAGIFSVGTYSDFEAWIALPEAQKILGWGTDVSEFLIPVGAGLSPGDTLSNEIIIAARGQAAANALNEWDPLLDLLAVIVVALGAAAAFSLASMLWRLAWLRRRQFAILRSLGFRRIDISIYLFVQSIGITAVAYLVALLVAMSFTGASQIRTIGVTIEPSINWAGAALALLAAIVIVFIGSLFPSWRMARLDLLDLLRAE